MEYTGKKKSSGSLAPGFRFHPTDEELVRYYLRRKVCGKAFRYDAISEIDIYKTEPWDLPSMSRLQTRDKEWYFFSMLDKKYGNGSRTNRATEKGYWKTTGKDRAVYHKTEIIGMKKTLVYHNGRAPKGQRSNWVMHEYKLVDIELEKVGIVQKEAFVLCRVFQKSGSGPKNGEQYGAPFVEEEWEDDELELDELELFPKAEAAEEFYFDNDVYLDSHDLEQILGSDIPSDTIPLPLNVHYGDDATESVNDTQNLLVSAADQYCESEHFNDDKIYYNMSAPYDLALKTVKREYIGESSKTGNSEDVDYLLDEPFFDASDYDVKFGDGGFIEANDLLIPVETDDSGFDVMDEYLTFFNANDDNPQYFTYDSELMLDSDGLFADKSVLPTPELDEGTERAVPQSGQFDDNSGKDSEFSSNDQELSKYQSDFQYPFIKKASQMLGNIPAPPAFASEFPSKDAVLRLNSAAQSSSHVTAGMIQIRNLSAGTDWSSFGKNDNLNIILSFGFARGDDGSASLVSSVGILPPGKTVSTTISRGWLCFMLLWVLILSISIKIGTCIYAN